MMRLMPMLGFKRALASQNKAQAVALVGGEDCSLLPSNQQIIKE